MRAAIRTIGINFLGYGEKRFEMAPSIYRVLTGLTRALIQEEEIRFVIFCRKDPLPEERGRRNLRVVKVPFLTGIRARGIGFLMRVPFEHLLLPPLLRFYGIDLLLCPDHYSPLLYRGRTMVIVHDLSIFKEIKTPLSIKLYLKPLMRATLPSASLIVCVSRNTRDDLIDRFPLLGERAMVLPNAVDTALFKRVGDGLEEFLMERYSLAPGYILFIGALEERKNPVRMIEAFAEALRQGIRQYLVIVGKGRLEEGLKARVKSLGISEMVRFIGNVPSLHLTYLYSGASFLLFPTLYEGFGLPALEAMACGTPVVASKGSSLPEVCGDAAFYVDPGDPSSIKDGIIAVASRSELRAEMALKGFERARNFSFEKNARILLGRVKNM